MHGDFDDWMDLNGDGEVDIVERELAYETYTNHSTSSFDDEGEEEGVDELLVNIGLERYDLEDMDEDERREALEDAGIYPNDFDF